MKLFYELKAITIASDQYHTVHPWPTRLTRAVVTIAVALLTWLLITAIRIEYAIRVVAAALLATAESYAGAIRIATTAGRVTLRIAWKDHLAYEIGRLLMGNRLEGVACTHANG